MRRRSGVHVPGRQERRKAKHWGFRWQSIEPASALLGAQGERCQPERGSQRVVGRSGRALAARSSQPTRCWTGLVAQGIPVWRICRQGYAFIAAITLQVEIVLRAPVRCWAPRASVGSQIEPAIALLGLSQHIQTTKQMYIENGTTFIQHWM